MAENVCKVDAKSVAREAMLTVRITRLRQWRLRLWLGCKLIRLAAWIMWMPIEIEEQ